MNTTPLIAGATAALIAALVAGPMAATAHADQLVADSHEQGVLVAAAPSVAHRPAVRPAALASRPRTIVVTGHGGQPVALFATGQAPIRQPRPGSAPATFGGLTAGTAYTVIVGGHSLGSVTAINPPAPATRLLAHAIGAPGSVTLSWQYHASRSTGGSRVGFDIQASGPGVPVVRSHVAGGRSSSLTGLATDVLYTFSVTPANSAGRGRATTATMTRTLAQLAGTPVTPASPSPAPAPAPAPVPIAPASPVAPATRTIYVCPDGYSENATGTCTTKLPYTYHRVVTGPAPIVDSYETTSYGCPNGYSLEDYTWIRYCRLYGPAPTAMVKDATPSGFTDTGTDWERTVPKVAVVVPA